MSLVPTHSAGRVLYISDSLGTPIHARGIYNFSIALVEMIKDFGFSLTLLVERNRRYGVNPNLFSNTIISKKVLDAAETAEVYRYFSSEHFHASHKFENKRLQQLVDKKPEVAKRILAATDSKGRNVITSSNRDVPVDFVPGRSAQHLAKFDAFMMADRIYSDSITRGFNGMPPVTVDATGYTAVFVDTPHNIAVSGIDPKRIFSVVHDLIPISDPMMGNDWRTMFLMKLQTTLAHKGNMIFVSETTKALFYDLFSREHVNSDVVIYPSIRSDLLVKASAEAHASHSDYMKRIARDKPNERVAHLAARMNRLGQDASPATLRSKQIEATFPNWNSNLPYLTTTLSDEPRKNVQILVDASRTLVGKANIVVMGQINGNAYMNLEPELYPNIHFTGYVSEVQKVDILRHATALVFPSFAEGFGIPLVEGALFGIPVICSDIPVFRELTQGLARYFDPYKVEDLVSCITDLLKSPMAGRNAADKLLVSVRKRFTQDVMKTRLRDALSGVGVDLPAMPQRLTG